MYTIVTTTSSVKAKTGELYRKANGQLGYVDKKHRDQHFKVDMHIISDEKSNPKGWCYDAIRKCTCLNIRLNYDTFKIVRSTDRNICPYDVRTDIIFHYIYHFNRNEVFDFDAYWKSLFVIPKPIKKLKPVRNIACDKKSIFIYTNYQN
jgi:hypothetical protein